MSGPLENLEQYQQALDEAFQRHGVALAYLYGSQARGDARPLSDVDVAVQFTPDLPRRERFSQMGRLTSDLCRGMRRSSIRIGRCVDPPFHDRPHSSAVIGQRTPNRR